MPYEVVKVSCHLVGGRRRLQIGTKSPRPVSDKGRVRGATGRLKHGMYPGGKMEIQDRAEDGG